MILEAPFSEASQPLTPTTDFIPSAALPPLELISPRLLDLARQLGELISADCLPVLRLLTPFGDITGLGLPAKGREKRLVYELAGHFARQAGQGEALTLLDDLDKHLQSPAILSLFPELSELPGADNNLLWTTHAKLIGAEAYPLLAVDLQLGLIATLSRTRWVQSKSAAKSLDARLTGVLRIIPLLPVDELATALTLNNDADCGALIWRVTNSLTRLKDESLIGLTAHKLPLNKNTRRSYFIDCCRLLNHPAWAATIELETPLGENTNYSNSPRSWRKLLAEDDDLPESDLAPDRFRVKHLEKIERQVRRALLPGAALEETEKHREEHPGLAIYGEELAVLREYVHPLAWNSAHPKEIAALLGLLCKPPLQLKSLSNDRLAIRTVILSLCLTGRSLEWWLKVELGEPGDAQASDQKLSAPRYVPEWDAIVYWPEAIPDLPTHAERAADLFEPVSPVWILPLPEPLIPWWREVARRQPKGSPMLAVTTGQVKKALKDATAILRKVTPAIPSLTEGRLRAGYTALIECEGQLDPVLAAFISGQWRLSLRVPLFYTTVRLEFLAERYRAAVRKVWQLLRQLEPTITDIRPLPLPILPNLFLGSPYYPRQDVLRQALQTIQAAIDQATNDEDRHNALTLKVLYGLALFGGLRISEAGSLRAEDFDLNAIWGGRLLALLVLAETKGNRWTSSARLLPLAEPLLPLLRELLPKELDRPAFYFLSKGKIIAADPEEIRRQIARLGVPFPRWHAGRHHLRTFLLEHGLPFDTLNDILGHQSAGCELFNFYLPKSVNRDWEIFQELATELARRLEWRE